jgi:predicted transcriptional regulator
MVKIFSIKNEYSEKIFTNKKQVEFRRQDVRIKENERCFIYTTAPVKKITGYFVVKEKIRLPIEKLWKKTRVIAGVTRSQFMEYFKGCMEGTAIFFKRVKRFAQDLTLDELKQIIRNFTPPQSYCNIDDRINHIIISRVDRRMLKLSEF